MAAPFASHRLTTPTRNILTSTTLDVSTFVLTTLRDAARISHFPYLNEAAILALGILTVVQDMKDCKEGFQRLARDVCGLVSAVIEAHSGDGVPASGLQQDVENLIMTLTSILDFAKGELSKGIFRRIINHSSDRAKISEYREALRQSLDVFGLTSMVSTRENITYIVRHQNELLRQLQELRGLLRDVVPHRGVQSSSAS